jgi:23S rRNA (cytosine1962-C5)-methyltransferase
MEIFDFINDVTITPDGVGRLRRGHLWIYASDVASEPKAASPLVCVRDAANKVVGYALYSAQSQIRLRFLSREVPTPDLIRRRILSALERRRGRIRPEGACRLVYGEADLIPSVIVDQYAGYLVLQTLSSGAEALKGFIVSLLMEFIKPKGILERNDVKARALEGLDESAGLLAGDAPERVQILESGIRFDIDLLHGQKTGFFLDQADNRVAASQYAHGNALDCFTNTGGFALHFAARCEAVTAVDISAPSLAQARKNAALNGTQNLEFLEANVFDFLRERERSGERFATVCLDPPAFAKSRGAVHAARAGYKEINLRAMKLLQPEGILITSSCSYHMSEDDFLGLIRQASLDARRPVHVIERRAQSSDHPILLGMPETHYLKCLILRVL